MRVTLENNELDCGPTNNCVRHSLEPWGKFLAVAPVSADQAYFLVSFATLDGHELVGGELELKLITVDFGADSFTVAS